MDGAVTVVGLMRIREVSEEKEGLLLIATIEESGDAREDLVAALHRAPAEVIDMKAAVHSEAGDHRPQGREADSCERVVAATREVLADERQLAHDLLTVSEDPCLCREARGEE